MTLTDEQQEFVNLARQGRNVLVDACIGSGKTTTIQHVCQELPGKSILYLTYNRRLLLEARDRIQLSNVDVHTFHSFAGTCLAQAGIRCGSEREAPGMFASQVQAIKNYDVVIVDEYQDLESMLADMLGRICYLSWNQRPGFLPQFLIVGDMDQKIYDYTRFDAKNFVDGFMSTLTGGYEQVYFTRCFRLSQKIAADLGQAWGKSIVGVNPDCRVSRENNIKNMVKFLALFEPEEILVLGGNNGARAEIQNRLEREYPDKFNKNTVYSSTRDRDGDTANMDTSHAAIFTTYDSAKGLERPVCVVCDFTDKYLDARLKYSTSRKILKNLFLVAASRGKNFIVFYVPPWADELRLRRVGQLSGPVPVDMRPETMSGAFDYKQHEDVDECFSYLSVEKLRPAGEKIETQRKTGMIDLSSCIGIYAQAAFFRNYDIDQIVRGELGKAVGMEKSVVLPPYDSAWPMQKKILYLTALDTGQERYFYQVTKNYIDRDAHDKLIDRLSGVFDRDEPDVERRCSVVYTNVSCSSGPTGDKMMTGRCDVISDDMPYELKFVSKLKTEHMLQAAMYVIALGHDEGRLWNLYDGEMYRISVSDIPRFLTAVCKCISKDLLTAKTVRLPTHKNGRVVIQID